MQQTELTEGNDTPVRLLQALDSTQRINCLTHNFYRYPATAPPELVRELILQFSDANDYVLDPFMGGGTTVVEALAHGRKAIGLDINALAVFVTRAKTTPISATDWAIINEWGTDELFLASCEIAHDKRVKNLPEIICRPLSGALSRLNSLRNSRQRRVVRCALLKTTQWALESRDTFPGCEALEAKFKQILHSMKVGMNALVEEARKHGITKSKLPTRRRLARASAQDFGLLDYSQEMLGKIQLVVTSPPYPGVHVLYHRWQIKGRRETGAPYWIARHRDGFGPSYYTMGGRSQKGLETYFQNLQRAFSSIQPLLTSEAIVIQLVAFNNAHEQMPRYLSVMKSAGYIPLKPFEYLDSQLVRQVPNRRWYARGKELDGSKEYLLFHTIAP